MYAVAWFKPDAREGAIFANVFPDYDMAMDCVIYLIKEHHGDEINDLGVDHVIAGQHYIYYEDTVYLVGKLFNFNPKGL